MDTTFDILLFNTAWFASANIEIMNARGNNDIAQSEIYIRYTARDANHQQYLRIKIIDNIISNLLRGIISLLIAARDNNRTRFPCFGLELADTITSPALAIYRRGIEPVEYCVYFIPFDCNVLSRVLPCSTKYLQVSFDDTNRWIFVLSSIVQFNLFINVSYSVK